LSNRRLDPDSAETCPSSDSPSLWPVADAAESPPSTQLPSQSLYDLANRGIDTWVNAHLLATGDNSSFWDEIALYLQDHAMFWEDTITRDDLRLEFDAVLKRLPEMPLDERLVSDRFSGQQRLVIVCIGLDTNFVDSELSPDLWSSCDGDTPV
jgi:hypothetical protein